MYYHECREETGFNIPEFLILNHRMRKGQFVCVGFAVFLKRNLSGKRKTKGAAVAL
jgi:hypothetical protein